MNPQTYTDSVIRTVLVQRGLNQFSIPELRDAFVLIDGGACGISDKNKLYAKMYNKALSYCLKGWLRVEGQGKQRRYYQTDAYKKLDFSIREIEHPLKLSCLAFEEDLNQCKIMIEKMNQELYECKKFAKHTPEISERLMLVIEQVKYDLLQLQSEVSALLKIIKSI